ncbi:protein CURLY FLAG LEAF 1-like [Diospyros lotus]|uniref:protein CURLY FLAG LEAF 1-like n=1 Tax=Diospyros lotus TaxID=55363 RepID=UPI00225695D9|nr:protein CURLY FLAG LEAF 1-like [Diospyros lotus]
MAAPNMAAITASLERSMQNCSLNQSSGGGDDGASAGVGFSSSSDSPENQVSSASDVTLELNSQISLPYFWEQCLDLKTGEVYYINWKTGMKAKDDPRTLADQLNDEIYSEDESSYDSEESSLESSPTSSRNQQYHHHIEQKDHVLVVAGCKSCLMYFMVPKQVGVCPKCCGQLLHFHRSETGSP